MSGFLFFRHKPSLEKSAALEPNLKAIVILGVFLLAILGVAIYLYMHDQAEPGRLVIDLAIAFFAWATGRVTGERAASGNQ